MKFFVVINYAAAAKRDAESEVSLPSAFVALVFGQMHREGYTVILIPN
jgi:hypothetical protein